MRVKLIYAILFMLLGWSTKKLTAQNQNAFNKNTFEIKNITPGELLYGLWYESISVDSSDFFWMSNKSGLYKYDGTTLFQYKPSQNKKKLILHDTIYGAYSSMIDEQNHLWYVERGTNSIYEVELNTLDIKQIIHNKESDSKGILIKNDDNNFWISQSREGEIFCKPLSTNNQSIIKFFQTDENLYEALFFNDRFYIRTSDLVRVFDLEGQEIQTEDHVSSSFFVQSESDTPFLFNENEYTVYKLNTENNTFDTYFKLPQKFGEIQHLSFHKEYVFIINDQQKLYLWNIRKNTIEYYSDFVDDFIRDDVPYALAGNLDYFMPYKENNFIFSKGNAIILLSKRSDYVKDYKETLPLHGSLNSMRGLVEDENKNIYASYYVGIAKKEIGSNEFKDFNVPSIDKKAYEASYSLNYKDQFLLWDLSVIDLKKNEVNHIESEKYGYHTTHYLEHDTLWIFSWYSNSFIKYIIPDKKWTYVKKKLVDNPIQVYDMILDTINKTFILAGEYYGILQFDKSGELIDKWLPDDFGNQPIYIFCLDKQGDTLWFGFNYGFGRISLKTKEYKFYQMPHTSAKRGNFNKKVFSMIKDSLNNYYLGTDQGLGYFDTKNEQWSNIVSDHPLANIEFNRNSTLRSSSGEYYMGSIDGLYKFSPNDLLFEIDAKIPDTKLSKVEVYNENKSVRKIDLSVKINQEIILSPTDNYLKLYFSTPSFKNKAYYSYKISDIRDNWSPPENNPLIEINSFPPGEYTLELRTYLFPDSGIYNSKEFIVIKIEYWYKSLVFLFASVLLISGIITYILRYRYKEKLLRQEKDAKLRTKISSNLHDEVGSLLSGLAFQSEVMAIDMNKDQKKGMEEISDMSREAMERMRDIVWAIDSRKDKVDNLVLKMKDFATKHLGNKGILYEFSVNKNAVSIPLDPEKRQQLYLIFREAITNIIKHSNADTVTIKMNIIKNKLQLIIHDNGSITKNQFTDGQGLTNMKMRMKSIHGEITINSQHGFKITCLVPL